MTKNNQTQQDSLKAIILKALEEIKAIDVVTMDVAKLTSVADTMIVATGASSRQVKALASNVEEEAKKLGYRAIGVEGVEESEWILIDFGDVLVHIMQPQSREFYDLERLWGLKPSMVQKESDSSDSNGD